MDSSSTSSSSISARPFNEYAFINLCATGQVDNLTQLLEVEKRYSYNSEQCQSYRNELDSAQAQSPDVSKSSSSNADWRYRISRWMLRASDELSGISRETAMVALSFCDRYLMHKKINRKLFQVVAISCLYYASKLLEKKAIPIAALMNYTQGKFDRGEVLSIEKELVSTLAKFSYPPSASTFCLIFLSGFPASVSTSSTSLPLLADTSQFMIELASCDFFFVSHKQSKIALAAIIVTLDQLQVDTSSELIQSWLTKIKQVVGYTTNGSSTTDDIELLACTKQLRNIYSHNDSRIKALDNCKEDNTKPATEEQTNDRKRSPHRVSPTPEDDDQPAVPKEVTTATTDHQFTSISDRVKMKVHPNDNDCIDGGNPKRQRYSM